MPNSPSRPEDALDTFSPFINGAILALYFTVTQVVTTNDKLCAAICILIAGGFFFYNYYLMGRPIFLKRSPGRYLGAAFLILNAVLLTWGTFSSDGLKPWIAIFVIQLLSVAMPVSLLSIYGTSFIKKSLLTIALFFIWFGIINLAASVLGYSKVEMTERETKYTSHFIAGGFRYQTPLYSSWQVSGMLRWAVPLTMAYLIFTKFKDKLFSICLTVFFIVGTAVMVLVDYRAAVFPLVGLVLWGCLLKIRLRVLACVVFFAYMFVAPVLFGVIDIGSILQQITPDWALRLAGNQKAADVFTLSGRNVMWRDAINALGEGTHMFRGDGHSYFNAYNWLSDQRPYQFLELRGERLGFHQGVLDLIFIYGLCFTFFLTIIIGWTIVRGMLAQLRPPLVKYCFTDTHFALLSLGLVGLSNCHDGFFASHNLFYIICVICCWAIWDEQAWLRRRPARPAPLNERLPARPGSGLTV